MSAAQLLDRLQKVKKIGRNSWIACCPAHQDRTPSLSIREKDDGTVLIKDFAGCSALDVITAVGLEFPALFPPRQEYTAPSHSRVSARELLQIISPQAFTVWLIGTKLLAGQPMTEQMHRELTEAVRRIGNARDEMSS